MVSVLIVGASVAGIRTAQALRAHGYSNRITVLEAETRPPYDKPPLSKEMLLQSANPAPVPLLSTEELDALDIDLRLGVRALSLDAHDQLVTTANGQLSYSKLVLATGAQAVRLPGTAGLQGIYTLRTADDALTLRAELTKARNVVIIGAGFIGAEFAAAATTYGIQVDIVEAQAVPLAHILGAEVGAELACLHEMHGVTVHTGSRVEQFLGGHRIEYVVLTDGRRLPADLVVIGIGVRPATEWLSGSGLPVDNGVLCGEDSRVCGFGDIHAVGDVALRRHPIYGGSVLRIEHWTNAGEMADLAAAAIAGAPLPKPQVPYVWSDQYGRRIQIIGRPSLGRIVATSGSINQDSYVAVYADAAGVAVGAVVVDDSRSFLACRRIIAQRRSAAEIKLAPR